MERHHAMRLDMSDIIVGDLGERDVVDEKLALLDE